MDTNQIKIILRFQRLDVYGQSESVNMHVKSDSTLKDLKLRIYKRLDVEAS